MTTQQEFQPALQAAFSGEHPPTGWFKPRQLSHEEEQELDRQRDEIVESIPWAD